MRQSLSLLRALWLTLALAFACAIPSQAQGPSGKLNLATQVQGVLGTTNGGFGISTGGLNGCALETDGVWTVNTANCAATGTILVASTSNQTIFQTNSGFGVTVKNTGTTPVSTTNMNLSTTSIVAGFYNNNGPWAGIQGLHLDFMVNTPSIAQGFSSNFTCIKVGDCAWDYAYNLFYGGAYFGSDEEQQGIDYHDEQVGYFQGALNNPVIGTLTGDFYNTTTGQLYLWDYTNEAGGISNLFAGNGALNSFSIISTETLTAQTGYAVIYTPTNTSGVVSINQVIPVPVAASTGTQTWTSSTFGTVNILAGQGIGFYLSSGNGIGAGNVGKLCGPTGGGIPVTGDITVTAACGNDRGVLLTASLAPIGTGSTVLGATGVGCFSHGQGCEGQASAGFAFVPQSIILDFQTVLSTATITSMSQVGGDYYTYTTTGGSYTQSTAWGTMATGTPNGSTTNSTVAVSVTASVTLGTSPASPGSFTTGLACMAQGYQDNVMITAAPAPVAGVQTITFTTYHNWQGGVLIMQGGPCGQFIVDQANATIGTGNAYWPMAYQVLGAFSTTQLATANCWSGDCIGPVSSNTIPQPVAFGPASISRTTSVAGLTPGQLNVFPWNYPVGSTIVVFGCTVHTDLNGTFTVATNSLDNFNSAITWAQTGADEGPDHTCNIGQPQHVVNFYPGAFAVYSPSLFGVEVTPNNTTWNPGDSILDAPTTQIGLTDIQIVHGQSTPSQFSGGISEIDDGPTGLPFLFQAENSGFTVDGSAYQAAGRFSNMIDVSMRPNNNGALIHEHGAEPQAGNAKPYYLFVDDVSVESYITDPLNHRTLLNFDTADPVYVPVLGFDLATNPLGGGGVFFGSQVFNGVVSFVGYTCIVGNYVIVNGTPEIDGCDPTTHKYYNITNYEPIPLVIGAGSQAANTCTAISNFTLAGVTTTPMSLVTAGFTGPTASLVGWGANGGVTIRLYPIALNTVGGEICNQSGSPVSYSAITFTVGAR
ncbi:hypothetical protein [Granulicella sp. L46]|uniref:hypothetical protein n=1 Tax=Granulicella sp. L46 TaxID=1641865 RepID=UPI00131E1060|nr:hypothetical protein [Granulicella sp. L46]